MKANKANFRLLCRAYYELTGDASVFKGSDWYQITDNCKSTFIQNFWHLYHEIKTLVNRGEICRFPICVGGKKLPYILNSLDL